MINSSNEFKENILVVIESNGKKNKVKKIFNEIGFLNVNVFSTKGRLLDLPKDSLGFNESNFSDFDRRPLSQGKVNELLSLSSSSDAVFIFTDDDIEGEVIAKDIENLIGDKPSYRIKSQSISKQGVVNSLSNIKETNHSLVKGGLSRRIFDRYVGFNTPKEKFTDVRVGRILTPILSSLEANNSPSAILNYSQEIEGVLWNIDIPVMPSEMKDLENLFFEMSELDAPNIECTNTQLVDDYTIPFTAGSALLQLSSSLEQPVSIIAENMQELYEDGTLSYPRTDSFYLSEETIKSMKKMALNFGVKGFDADFFKNKVAAMQSQSLRSQESHEGLHVLTDNVNLFGPCDAMSLKEQILTLVARQNIRAGQKDKKTEISSGKISLNSPGWSNLLSKLKSEPIVESRESIHMLTGRRVSLNEMMNPLGFTVNRKKRNNASLKIIKNDQKVLSKMIELGIGRPSTYAYHSEKIGNRFLDNEGKLNSFGLDSITHAKKYAPGLLSAEKSIAIEDNLHFQGGSIDERVKNAIIISGMTTKGSSGKSSLYKTDAEISDENSEEPSLSI